MLKVQAMVERASHWSLETKSIIAKEKHNCHYVLLDCIACWCPLPQPAAGDRASSSNMSLLLSVQQLRKTKKERADVAPAEAAVRRRVLPRRVASRCRPPAGSRRQLPHIRRQLVTGLLQGLHPACMQCRTAFTLTGCRANGWQITLRSPPAAAALPKAARCPSLLQGLHSACTEDPQIRFYEICVSVRLGSAARHRQLADSRVMPIHLELSAA